MPSRRMKLLSRPMVGILYARLGVFLAGEGSEESDWSIVFDIAFINRSGSVVKRNRGRENNGQEKQNGNVEGRSWRGTKGNVGRRTVLDP